MNLIQELDQLLGDVHGFPLQWTSTYHGGPVSLVGVSEGENDRDSYVLVYPIGAGAFDRMKYQKVTLFDPELDHMFGDFKRQMLKYLSELEQQVQQEFNKHRTRPLGAEDDRRP